MSVVEVEPTWQDEAACRGLPIEMFFPQGNIPVEARATCSGCAVQAECLVAALVEEVGTGHRSGLRGGLSPMQRRAASVALGLTWRRWSSMCKDLVERRHRAPGPPSRSGYTYGCRCAGCRAEEAAYTARRAQVRLFGPAKGGASGGASRRV